MSENNVDSFGPFLRQVKQAEAIGRLHRAASDVLWLCKYHPASKESEKEAALQRLDSAVSEYEQYF